METMKSCDVQCFVLSFPVFLRDHPLQALTVFSLFHRFGKSWKPWNRAMSNVSSCRFPCFLESHPLQALTVFSRFHRFGTSWKPRNRAMSNVSSYRFPCFLQSYPLQTLTVFAVLEVVPSYISMTQNKWFTHFADPMWMSIYIDYLQWLFTR